MPCVFEKLPLVWSIFKDYLRHKRKEMTTVEIFERINMHEQYMNVARGGPVDPMIIMTHFKASDVEHEQSSNGHDFKYKQKKQEKK